MRARTLVFLSIAFGAACTTPTDDPSMVHDLRVLAIRLDPPEQLLSNCDALTNPTGPGALELFAKLQAPLAFSALVVDPEGNGRALPYEIVSCPKTSDRTCDEERTVIARGTLAPGQTELNTTLTIPDAPSLFQRVLEEDPYHGLGGVRLPLTLEVPIDGQPIDAQKLMVFNCHPANFPPMTANVNPALPGLLHETQTWDAADEPVFTGQTELFPQPFDALQESYWVRSLNLEPYSLQEAWKVAWHTDFGKVSPYETGGFDFTGVESRHRVVWTPGPERVERVVRFWIVVRDGRGGTQWLTRTARYRPASP